MPASSMPPASSAVPKSGGSGPYIAGVVVLGALIAGLIFWKSKKSDPPPPPIPTATATPQDTAPQLVNAPPPPPKIEEPDAGADAGAKGASNGGPKGTGPCGGGKCDGKSSPALESALRSTASSAQGCYNRALRSSAVSGSMTVSVQVGATGAVCGASIANDSVGSGEIRTCVLSRFQGKSFPPPASGCVVVNIPISFKIKE